ncbi:hypothetical protein M9H77_04950 [Catharanthus roseus]|uniref:Uncharacterized protein n=1 Tax=Catharanthus roseus TaxID=4058 RepID=A0ACC0CFI3_CATRO|nr:hypothetical protein M9H77_04950 [Catharanthus roseus]
MGYVLQLTIVYLKTTAGIEQSVHGYSQSVNSCFYEFASDNVYSLKRLISSFVRHDVKNACLHRPCIVRCSYKSHQTTVEKAICSSLMVGDSEISAGYVAGILRRS